MKSSTKKVNSLSFLLFKELIRNILKSWKQLISIIAISFLSICLFCGLNSNANNIRERENYLYQITNVPDIYLTTTGLSEEDNNFLNTLSGITKEERIYTNITVDNSSAYLISPEADATMSVPSIIDGEKGFLVMSEFLEKGEYHIGDTIEVSLTNFVKNSEYKDLIQTGVDLGLITLNDDFLNKDYLNFDVKISGTMYLPEGVQSSQFSPTVFYAERNYLKEVVTNYVLNSFTVNLPQLEETITTQVKEQVPTIIDAMNNQVIIHSSNIDETVNSIRTYFNDKEEKNMISCSKLENMAFYQALHQDSSQANSLTYVFPIIFFLVSVLIILTTLSQLILKEKQNIGTFKALGVKKKDLYLHYVLYGIVLTALGGVLGFIAGPLIIPSVMGIKYDLLWDLPKVSISFFYPLSIVIPLLMILFSGLCSFLVSYKIIKEKPVDTLNRKETGSFNKTETKKMSSKFLYLKMAFRNITRNKGKSLMVVVGALGCSALLVCGFGVMDTLNYSVDLDFKVNQYIEISALPKNADDDLLFDSIKNDEEVKKIEKYSSLDVTVSSTNSIDTSLYIREVDTLSFNVPLAVNDGLTIDQTTADKLNVEVDDTLTLYINNKPYERNIGYIFDTSVQHGIYDYARYYPDVSFQTTGYYIYLNNPENAEALKNKLEDTDDFLLVQTMDDLYEYANSLLGSIANMTNVIKIFAILLCFVVIYNLTSLNIFERTRDIATMKVIGFRFNEISRTLTYEIMIDTLLGIFIGLFLGYPLTILVMVVNITELLTFIYHINFYTYIICFLISAVFAAFVSFVLNIKIKKIDMSTSLKSVE